MIEFYRLARPLLLAVIMLSSLGVIAQTQAVIASFSRNRASAFYRLENLTEIAMLIHSLILAFMMSRTITDRKESLVMPFGHAGLRFGIFCAIAALALSVGLFSRKPLPFVVIPAAALTLPLMENSFRKAFPWLYILALLFWLGRAVYICVVRRKALRHEVSAFSIKEAIDALHTGLLYCKPNGEVMLMNRKMQDLMQILTGKLWRNGLDFSKYLLHGDKHDNDTAVIPKFAELEEEKVYLLEDGTAWLFTEAELLIGRKRFIQISAADVKERWKLTDELQEQQKELQHRSEELASTLKSLDELRRGEELLRIQSTVHDILAQRLALLVRVFRAEVSISETGLRSYADDMLAEIQAEIERDYSDLETLRQLYGDIGVHIEIVGKTPENAVLASFYNSLVCEGMTNAVRHGLATEVSVTCVSSGDGTTITVTNNGVPSNFNILEGSGISGLRRKAEKLGGNLEIATRPQFMLTAIIPNIGDRRASKR